MGKYLVTGVAGFIAAKVAQDLLQAGHEVIGVDNLNDYYDVELKKFRIKQLTPYQNFQFHTLDIEDLKGLEVIFQKHSFDAIINLAARAGVRYSMINPKVYFTTNVEGTLNLLELARKFQVKKFLLASTSSVYAGLPTPFVETMNVSHPISPYSSSKLSAESLTYTYHYLYGIDVSVVRYFTVYGPLGRPDMSPFRFIRWIDEGVPLEIFGDGEQKRDFTFVDDIASGTILALKNVGYEIFNLGGSGTHKLNSMIQLIEDQLGKKAQKIFKNKIAADMDNTEANIEKTQRILGWHPQFNLEAGLKNTIDHYKNHLSFYKSIKLP
jgi:UDP-glucuronate 4-epimerase